MDIVLIPVLWLDGSSWVMVVPVLEAAEHRAHPITLPGMASRDARRSGLTLGGHVEVGTSTIDSVAPDGDKVAPVGHSAGAGIAHAATDARPTGVAHAIYVRRTH